MVQQRWRCCVQQGQRRSRSSVSSFGQGSGMEEAEERWRQGDAVREAGEGGEQGLHVLQLRRGEALRSLRCLLVAHGHPSPLPFLASLSSSPPTQVAPMEKTTTKQLFPFPSLHFTSSANPKPLPLSLSVYRKVMHQLLCFKSKFPNHFPFTLGCCLFLLFLIQFI